MNSEVIVNIEDIKKAVYFISNLTQMQGNRPMRGALNSKGDYMGGIFDRWINIIPEGVIFNKIIAHIIMICSNLYRLIHMNRYCRKKVVDLYVVGTRLILNSNFSS